jgi:hypothetical protein
VAPDDLEGILAARGVAVTQRVAAVAMLLPAVLVVGLPLAVFVFPPFALAGWAGGRLVGLAVRPRMPPMSRHWRCCSSTHVTQIPCVCRWGGVQLG